MSKFNALDKNQSMMSLWNLKTIKNNSEQDALIFKSFPNSLFDSNYHFLKQSNLVIQKFLWKAEEVRTQSNEILKQAMYETRKERSGYVSSKQSLNHQKLFYFWRTYSEAYRINTQMSFLGLNNFKNVSKIMYKKQYESLSLVSSPNSSKSVLIEQEESLDSQATDTLNKKESTNVKKSAHLVSHKYSKAVTKEVHFYNISRFVKSAEEEGVPLNNPFTVTQKGRGETVPLLVKEVNKTIKFDDDGYDDNLDVLSKELSQIDAQLKSNDLEDVKEESKEESKE